MAKRSGQAPVNLAYVDHPGVVEVFADSLEKMSVTQATLRLEFVVNRLQESNSPNPPTGTKHTVCRLVLPALALPRLANQLANLMQALEAKGNAGRTSVLPNATSRVN